MNPSFQATFDLLTRYQSDDSVQNFCKAKMLELLATCDDCFLRSCRVGHFTASVFLVNTEKTHVLLMHHAKIDMWVQLGGHCDGDTDVRAVALKEAQEESGIDDLVLLSDDIFDLDIHLFPPRLDDPAHYHFDIRFIVHAHKTNDFVKNEESKGLQWVPLDRGTTLTSQESTLRMFKKIHDFLS